ncbi:UDP-N-acetylglucosamine 1-carboxyvinyltransferase [Halotalea alkalilenta]|uniref:UDP-N-acetylglucosamine 1-carboxyvinyltransferase n=1 Tax=Halotalea alkalilenta TaxID=376489 RepID=A0A172YGR4_9GAMM|nr:UDP-N-acetylglucosamine 1-carboxyvinyltransferase [Halotalea alkalilenta]ANF58404.1 UDP-N-acetylglucosamine 1-carboxyvinyltransferase [Halotalea alkalilenta]
MEEVKKSVDHQKLIVKKSVLSGEVKVSGAKNSVLRLLAASLLSSKKINLKNYPYTLLDAQVHVDMLVQLGKTVNVDPANNEITIEESKTLETDLVWNRRSIRNTLLILGALTARFGRGSVPAPGGCEIGSTGTRGFELHVDLLQKLGATVTVSDGVIHTEAVNGLIGNDIYLPIRSTGATENAILCGTLAKGITRIWNPHIRPEIIDLINFLNLMGAKIKVFGQEHIEIKGVSELRGINYEVMPDNVEALTWLIGASITGGEIEIQDFPFEHLEVPLIFLRESGVEMFKGRSSLVVRNSRCYPLEISTGPYPGINSDMQPLLATFAAFAKGESKFIDLRFPGRYGYAFELKKMGLDCDVSDNLLTIRGGNKLVGTDVTALDLRAGVAAALAGFCAEGTTVIHDAWQVARGYDNFVEKITQLGGYAEWQ